VQSIVPYSDTTPAQQLSAYCNDQQQRRAYLYSGGAHGHCCMHVRKSKLGLSKLCCSAQKYYEITLFASGTLGALAGAEGSGM
jgi:hypothetical protein